MFFKLNVPIEKIRLIDGCCSYIETDFELRASFVIRIKIKDERYFYMAVVKEEHLPEEIMKLLEANSDKELFIKNNVKFGNHFLGSINKEESSNLEELNWVDNIAQLEQSYY